MFTLSVATENRNERDEGDDGLMECANQQNRIPDGVAEQNL
jgi:hypothetical protein